MITMETDRLVDDYLRRLERAAARLQASRRGELIAEIREHIDAALSEEEAAGEAAVRNVLERLGPPEEIVDAAEPARPLDPEARGGKLELAAIVALLVPFLGWMAGIALVLVSRAWSTREKLGGIALGLIPALLPLLVLTAGATESGLDEAVPAGDPRPLGEQEGDGGGLGPAEVVGAAVFFLAGLPSAVFLAWRLRRCDEHRSASPS